MSAPGYHPRSRPDRNSKGSLPSPHDTGRPKSGAPPLPAPRTSLVSSLAKNFGGTTGAGTTGNSAPGIPENRGGAVSPVPAKPNGPPPPLPTSHRPSLTGPGTTAHGHPQQSSSEPTTSFPKSAPPVSKPPVLGSPSGPISPAAPLSPSSETTQPPTMSQRMEGFGSCLQNCYETITKRHDDELLVLESIRSHVFCRARLDKEYSENLLKVNGKVNRKMGNLSNKSSAIIQVINNSNNMMHWYLSKCIHNFSR